jgi:hypothetical protein
MRAGATAPTARESDVIPADLNILDEFYLHLDRQDEPWSVHLESP